jgi:hypothetical protein
VIDCDFYCRCYSKGHIYRRLTCNDGRVSFVTEVNKLTLVTEVTLVTLATKVNFVFITCSFPYRIRMNQTYIILPTRTLRNYTMSHVTVPDMFRCISHHPQGSHISAVRTSLPTHNRCRICVFSVDHTQTHHNQ